ncbi:MAG: diadenylate cyclase [Candidatus Binatia bacterium]
MFDTILQLLRDIKLVDLLDIALVTTFFYSALVLVRRTQARLAAGGVLVLVALFIVARVLDLRLTTWLLQGFFAVFVVMLLVIFQEELRQLFERLALWGRRRRFDDRPYGTVEMICACASDFVRARTGALIVLAGRQPFERHLHGGVELNGRLSEPLLRSIFDPHSPGHDGAMIIQNDTVLSFATQLPLSTDFRQLAGLGTRHSAALGLAERTDALCVVVSEERARISVARRGRLRALAGAAELATELHDFLRQLSPPGKRPGVWWSLLRENWVEKIASLALVMGLWYLFVPGSRPATVAYPIPVKVVNIPPGYELDVVEPSEVTAIFSGQRRAFYLFDPQRNPITIDASLARYGRRTFAISEQQIRPPPELTVEDVKPEQVRIGLRSTGGEPPPGSTSEKAPGG